MANPAELRCTPIGTVEAGLSENKKGTNSRYETVSRIRIFEEYSEGLTGLDEYSHVVILWWMDRADRAALKVNPLHQREKSVGIFATRFPARVNPMGMSVVELVAVDGCFINVRGFDAWTGTSILDIKPYDYYDIVKSPRVSEWFKRFWEEHSVMRRYAQTVPWLGP
jgi:tRNA-Thr(GGU) m(6)t(6)A37 methyltransferase TsaA